MRIVLIEVRLSGEPEIEDATLALIDQIRRHEYTSLQDVDHIVENLRCLLYRSISIRRGSIIVTLFCADRTVTMDVLRYVYSGHLKADLEELLRRQILKSCDQEAVVSIELQQLHLQLLFSTSTGQLI